MRWQTLDLELLRAPEKRDPLLYRISVGKVWHFWEGRSAWYGTRVRQYEYQVAFQPTFELLVPFIERSRKQGSAFRAHELPTVIVAAKNRAIVLVDADAPIPFLGARGRGRLPERMYAFCARLLQHGHYASWEVTPSPRPERQPYIGYESYFDGSQSPIRWTRKDELVDLSEINRLLAAFRNLDDA